MTLSVITTAGAANANSYASVAEADAYHETRLHKEDWTTASATTKAAALVWASRLLTDRVDWHGIITNTDQALAWPRSGVVDKEGRNITYTAIPSFLINATSELARYLIAADRSADPDTKGFSSIAVGPIRLTVDKSDQIVPIPPSVASLISDYGCIRDYQSSSVSLSRC